MIEAGVSRSVLLDEALVAVLMPWPCPSEFGESGRYRLEELVGAGRNSLVYRATDQFLSSSGFAATVAIKIGRKNDSNDLEGLTARRITHPNVLRVLDRGVTPDGHGFVVTEFITGGDLQSRPGPWETRRAVEFMAKLCRAVHAAHSAGVVHCDLKPANILLTTEGEPKLADFDLSRSVISGDDRARGNLAFMSPEQFAGDPEGLTPLSDVYALGGILFFLLTGKMPNGGSASEVAAIHAADTPPPTTGRKDDLERICAKSLARSREERYESAAALAGDLERWLRHEPLAWGKTPMLRRTGLWCLRHPYRAAAVAGAIVLAAAGAIATYSQVRATQREQQAELRSQAEAIRKTDEMVKQTQARMRRHLEVMYRSIAGSPKLQDELLPTVVWLEWIADSPVIDADGRLTVSSGRIDTLRSLVERCDATGHGGDLDARLARFSLAHFLLIDDHAAAANEILTRVRSDWENVLAPNDPILLSITAMQTCCHALLDKDASDAERLAELKALDQRLESVDGVDATRHLIAREIQRLIRHK